MARRPPAQIELTMFPFLGVLCGMIGVFVLFLIIIISTRAVGGAQAPLPDSPPKDDLNPNAGDLDEQEYRRLEQQIASVATKLVERQSELLRLQSLESELQSLLDQKRDEAIPSDDGEGAIGVELDPPQDVEMIPDPAFRVDKQWIPIEIMAEGYIVHYQGNASRHALEEANGDDSNLTRVIDQVDARRNQEYLLLLVHPNGAAASDSLRKLIDLRYEDLNRGWEPFSKEWLLFESAPEDQSP